MKSPATIKQRAVSELIPYARNSRTHSDDQIAQIAGSIREFGFNNPVLIDKDSGIIAGHGRVLAARMLGLDKIPTILLDHLNDTQRRAYILADNKLALNAGWDDEALALELRDLESDIDLSIVGFSEDEIAELIASMEATEEGDSYADDDYVQDKIVEPLTMLGDIWKLGNHRIMCGDSTKETDVAVLMDGEKADMVFTDPPYALFGNSTGIDGVTDDKMVRPFFRAVMERAKESTKLNGHIYMCCDWHSALAIESVSREVELSAKNLCVWDKGDSGVGAMYQMCHELIWFFANAKKQTTTTKRKGLQVRTVHGKPNIWRFPRVSSNEREHNAAKPVDMICLPIDASSDAGDIVLDLFSGSGSTLIAAEKSNRLCRLMEIET